MSPSSTPSTAYRPRVSISSRPTDRVPVQEGSVYTLIPPMIVTEMKATGERKVEYIWTPGDRLNLQSKRLSGVPARSAADKLTFRSRLRRSTRKDHDGEIFTKEEQDFGEQSGILNEGIIWFDKYGKGTLIPAPSNGTGRLLVTPAILKRTAPSPICPGETYDMTWGIGTLDKVECSWGEPTYDEDGELEEPNAVTLDLRTGITQARFEGGKFVQTSTNLESAIGDFHVDYDDGDEDEEMEMF